MDRSSHNNIVPRKEAQDARRRALMAGHSQFKNIMHRKGAQDAKRAKHFTKLLREITVAARAGGIDPEINSQLRTALHHARRANMPKENIDRALHKATEEGGENYEALCYEALGPGQVAFIVEVLTDNRNRSASEIRTIFNKHGGHVADIAYLFDHVGVIIYPLDRKNELEEEAIEAGVSDIQETDNSCILICPKESFAKIREQLESSFGHPEEVHLAWIPHAYIHLDRDEHKQATEKLIAALEDHDDVRAVWTNWANEDQADIV